MNPLQVHAQKKLTTDLEADTEVLVKVTSGAQLTKLRDSINAGLTNKVVLLPSAFVGWRMQVDRDVTFTHDLIRENDIAQAGNRIVTVQPPPQKAKL